jgi:DNA-binding MarR family transcriptional regulator
MGRDRDVVRAAGGSQAADVGVAEAGLMVLLEVCERAVEEMGSAVPPAQLRALLVVDRVGGLNLGGLARALGASASATSRLIDRMQAGDLLTRDRAAVSRREIVLVPTESGRRLAGWVRGQRRAALGGVLAAMSQAGSDALARGFAEIAASAT